MVDGSLRILRLLPPLKTGHHDIAEILLKVALNTKNQSFIAVLHFMIELIFAQRPVRSMSAIFGTSTRSITYMYICIKKNYKWGRNGLTGPTDN
jgi:hypothetical protein